MILSFSTRFRHVALKKKWYIVGLYWPKSFCLTAFSLNIRRQCCQSYAYFFFLANTDLLCTYKRYAFDIWFTKLIHVDLTKRQPKSHLHVHVFREKNCTYVFFFLWLLFSLSARTHILSAEISLCVIFLLYMSIWICFWGGNITARALTLSARVALWVALWVISLSYESESNCRVTFLLYISILTFLFWGGRHLSSHAYSIGKSLRPPMHSHSAGMSYVCDVYIIYVKALYMLGFITM